eukprot:403340958
MTDFQSKYAFAFDDSSDEDQSTQKVQENIALAPIATTNSVQGLFGNESSDSNVFQQQLSKPIQQLHNQQVEVRPTQQMNTSQILTWNDDAGNTDFQFSQGNQDDQQNNLSSSQNINTPAVYQFEDDNQGYVGIGYNQQQENIVPLGISQNFQVKSLASSDHSQTQKSDYVNLNQSQIQNNLDISYNSQSSQQISQSNFKDSNVNEQQNYFSSDQIGGQKLEQSIPNTSTQIDVRAPIEQSHQASQSQTLKNIQTSKAPINSFFKDLLQDSESDEDEDPMSFMKNLTPVNLPIQNQQFSKIPSQNNYIIEEEEQKVDTQQFQVYNFSQIQDNQIVQKQEVYEQIAGNHDQSSNQIEDLQINDQYQQEVDDHTQNPSHSDQHLYHHEKFYQFQDSQKITQMLILDDRDQIEIEEDNQDQDYQNQQNFQNIEDNHQDTNNNSNNQNDWVEQPVLTNLIAVDQQSQLQNKSEEFDVLEQHEQPPRIILGTNQNIQKIEDVKIQRSNPLHLNQTQQNPQQIHNQIKLNQDTQPIETQQKSSQSATVGHLPYFLEIDNPFMSGQRNLIVELLCDGQSLSQSIQNKMRQINVNQLQEGSQEFQGQLSSNVFDSDKGIQFKELAQNLLSQSQFSDSLLFSSLFCNQRDRNQIFFEYIEKRFAPSHPFIYDCLKERNDKVALCFIHILLGDLSQIDQSIVNEISQDLQINYLLTLSWMLAPRNETVSKHKVFLAYQRALIYQDLDYAKRQYEDQISLVVSYSNYLEPHLRNSPAFINMQSQADLLDQQDQINPNSNKNTNQNSKQNSRSQSFSSNDDTKKTSEQLAQGARNFVAGFGGLFKKVIDQASNIQKTIINELQVNQEEDRNIQSDNLHTLKSSPFQESPSKLFLEDSSNFRSDSQLNLSSHHQEIVLQNADISLIQSQTNIQNVDASIFQHQVLNHQVRSTFNPPARFQAPRILRPQGPPRFTAPIIRPQVNFLVQPEQKVFEIQETTPQFDSQQLILQNQSIQDTSFNNQHQLESDIAPPVGNPFGIVQRSNSNQQPQSRVPAGRGRGKPQYASLLHHQEDQQYLQSIIPQRAHMPLPQ